MRPPRFFYIAAFISASIMFPVVIINATKNQEIVFPLLGAWWMFNGLGTVLGWGK